MANTQHNTPRQPKPGDTLIRFCVVTRKEQGSGTSSKQTIYTQTSDCQLFTSFDEFTKRANVMMSTEGSSIITFEGVKVIQPRSSP